LNAPLRSLVILFGLIGWIQPSVHGRAEPSRLPPLHEETSTPMPSASSPADIIKAVNNLRLQHGLTPLTVHDGLMEVAAEQANALATTEGAVGYNRTCGMTLGQELRLKGFPLLGDLSQGGYRTGNWSVAMTVEDTISMWLGEDEHTSTMLSEYGSDIGVAVAVSNQIYIVLETTLRMNSGKMQGTAYDILTGIPMTQAACMDWQTQSAELGPLAQYSVPVALSTARPDGGGIHKVKYGQTLWSLAIQYGTTIERIRRLNNLTNDIFVPGWKLLIQMGATQPLSSTIPQLLLNLSGKVFIPLHHG